MIKNYRKKVVACAVGTLVSMGLAVLSPLASCGTSGVLRSNFDEEKDKLLEEVKNSSVNVHYMSYLEAQKKQLKEDFLQEIITAKQYDEQVSAMGTDANYWEYIMQSKEKDVAPFAEEYDELCDNFEKDAKTLLNWTFGSIGVFGGVGLGFSAYLEHLKKKALKNSTAETIDSTNKEDDSKKTAINIEDYEYQSFIKMVEKSDKRYKNDKEM